MRSSRPQCLNLGTPLCFGHTTRWRHRHAYWVTPKKDWNTRVQAPLEYAHQSLRALSYRSKRPGAVVYLPIYRCGGRDSRSSPYREAPTIGQKPRTKCLEDRKKLTLPFISEPS